MQNADVARVFDEIADILEVQGANQFRVRAYRNASRMLGDLTESVAAIVADPDRKLEELPGIGADLATKIRTILETGELKQLNDLRKEVPKGVLDMMRLPGLGPKKAAALFKELKIASLEQLKAAAVAGQIAELKGFGKKTQETILKEVDRVADTGKRFSIAIARAEAEAIVADLLSLDSVTQATAAGSCRRRRDTCGDLDVLATSADPNAAMDRLAKNERVHEVIARGDTKLSVRLKTGMQLDLRVVGDESYGAAMQYFTGSKEHNIVIRRRAIERGLKINEYGVFRGDKQIAGRTEEEVYRAVDLPWIPPEMRENRGEIELAERDELPTLIELDDIRGDLHMHTTATDGTATIQAMAEAAKERGLKYIAITDHSKRVSMANGLDAKRLREHWKAIDKVRSEVRGIEILCGVECDILEDARMDLPDEVLKEADWVLGVLHYSLKQPRAQIMERLMTAIKCPYVDAIGHPTGRMIGSREGADIDFDPFLKACADHGVMLEINANPARLDLDDVHAAAAREMGIPIVINTDAHSTGGFDVLQYGVDQARRAGLTKSDVANTKTAAQLRKMLRRNK